jgi:hypothetical protein
MMLLDLVLRRRSLGRCLSGQRTGCGRSPRLRTRSRTANKQDQGKAQTQKPIRLRKLSRPYQNCFTAVQNKYSSTLSKAAPADLSATRRYEFPTIYVSVIYMRCTTAAEDPCVSGKSGKFSGGTSALAISRSGFLLILEHLAPLARTDVITGKIASE